MVSKLGHGLLVTGSEVMESEPELLLDLKIRLLYHSGSILSAAVTTRRSQSRERTHKDSKSKRASLQHFGIVLQGIATRHHPL